MSVGWFLEWLCSGHSLLEGALVMEGYLTYQEEIQESDLAV